MADPPERITIYYFAPAAPDVLRRIDEAQNLITQHGLIAEKRKLNNESIQFRKDIDKKTGTRKFPILYSGKTFIGDLEELSKYLAQRFDNKDKSSPQAPSPSALPGSPQSTSPKQPQRRASVDQAPVQGVPNAPHLDEEEPFLYVPKSNQNVLIPEDDGDDEFVDAQEAFEDDDSNNKPSKGLPSTTHENMQSVRIEIKEPPKEDFIKAETPPVRHNTVPEPQTQDPPPVQTSRWSFFSSALSTLESSAKQLASWWSSSSTKETQSSAQQVEQALAAAKATDTRQSSHYAVTRINKYNARQLRVLRLTPDSIQRMQGGDVRNTLQYKDIIRIERRSGNLFVIHSKAESIYYESHEWEIIIRDICRRAAAIHHNIPIEQVYD